MGLYPAPVLRRIEPAAVRYIETIKGPTASLEMSQQTRAVPPR
jgi:hypothetical protein